MTFEFWKFCNCASCLHNKLSRSTAASNTECEIINKKQKKQPPPKKNKNKNKKQNKKQTKQKNNLKKLLF